VSAPSPSLLRRQTIGPHLKIILDDPRRQNALSPDMVEEIDRALVDSHAQGLACLVVEGANGIFSAGADLKSLSDALANPPAADAEDPLEQLNMAGGHFFARFNAHPMPTIAVVDGAAFGGGMGLACCADVVIATSRARFALSETSLGFPPAQIAPYLVARLGERVARRLALTGARLDGREAAALGLADFYCDTDEERVARLTALLQDISRCAPGANAATKRLLFESRAGATPAYIEDAAQEFARGLRGEEGREGVAAFIEKRKPSWTRRSS
jgi:isohexenylglutaconyl-CoA hydratase